MTTKEGLEPDGWRDIPEEYQGTIDPNHYCRGWNAKRDKYCRAIAGTGTDHPGEGRCRFHGGNATVTTGKFVVTRYANLENKRIRELYEQREQDTDPLNLLPEVALLRAVVHDFIERNDAFQEMLLAWYQSWSAGKQPSPGQIRAFGRVIDEYEDMLRAREAEDSSPEMRDLAMARLYLKALDELEENPKPRKVLDITVASKLLVDISAIVSRIEKSRSENAMSRPEFFRMMEKMGVVVKQKNDIEDPEARLKAIEEGWYELILRVRR